jgi:hypothetical protein
LADDDIGLDRPFGGVMSNFRQLWQDGFGKLAAVYLVSLFGFVVWVGFVISWLFFAGVKPPLAS